MLYFIPWVVLILAAIIAVPVAAAFGPRREAVAGAGEADEPIEDGDEVAIVEDDFGGSEIQEIGDGAFDDFK